uniref:uncharacterized protein n=1 Tax=Pristiophorus japonicus TaxID=55135 RepID=UPI00398ED842
MALNQVSSELWAKHKNHVGQVHSAVPHRIQLIKNAVLPSIRQYRLPPEAENGIEPVISALLEQGVLEKTQSPCNTPILPIPKVNRPNEWRFVQDLRAINKIVVPITPVVPDTNIILSAIPPTATVFTVIDLCSAFFSIPLNQESQYLFAFTYKKQQYTWTRLPQGYTESPAVYAAAVKRDLEDCSLSDQSVLLQYADDLLVASSHGYRCMQDSLKLLQHLCERGHRVSLPKLQFCQTQVQYLGFHISQGQRQLGPERIQTIQRATIPKTKKDILSFLGMVGYCRQWIPDYREWDAVLRSVALNDAPPKVEWTPEREEAFKQLKKAITNAPALGLPNYGKPFQMYVNEKEGFATAVLTQEHGGGNRPVAYYSVLLPPVVRGMPACLRAVAATAVMVEKSVPIVLDYPCTVITAHAVLLLLNSAATQHFTASRRTGYEVLLLSHPNYTFRRAPVVNPATFLPTREVEDPDQHDCLLTVEIATLPRPDLLTEPMDNPDLILYADGSSYRPSDNLLLAGYAIENPHETIEAFALPPGTSAQAAELFALTRACIIAKDQTANIYTDSRYAFGVVHDFGQLWKNRGFITSGGKHIKHSQLVLSLLDAIQLPSNVAVVKCAAHTTGEDEVSVGNRRADEAAKQAALAQADCLQAVSVSPPQILDIQQLKTAQQQVTIQERRTWENQGCFLKNNIWYHPDGRTVCPRSLFLPLSRLAHGQAHMGKGGMIHAINAQWYAPGITVVIEKVARTCQICQQNNRGKTPAEYDLP